MGIGRIAAAVPVMGAVVALAACGGGGGSDGGGSTTQPSGAQTVSAQTIGGVGTVLVDAEGEALYVNDQDATGMISCLGKCTSIWPPLTLPSGTAKPVAADGLSGKLGVVMRPDGARQVTWAGKPLYTFAEDGGPGKVTGNGTQDSFGGLSFTWHVAATGKVGGTKTSTQPRGGYGY